MRTVAPGFRQGGRSPGAVLRGNFAPIPDVGSTKEGRTEGMRSDRTSRQRITRQLAARDTRNTKAVRDDLLAIHRPPSLLGALSHSGILLRIALTDDSTVLWDR